MVEGIGGLFCMTIWVQSFVPGYCMYILYVTVGEGGTGIVIDNEGNLHNDNLKYFIIATGTEVLGLLLVNDTDDGNCLN